ncbi:MAG TPA: hypothetical protein VHG91_08645 [Longimicrobium sp.]|nr:hypothetical protein [Longimicrobium sp.]
MIALTLHLPESVHRKVKELADRDGITVDQFLASAAAEKVAALLTQDYLEERGRRGSREAYERILSKVPSGEPEPYDRI